MMKQVVGACAVSLALTAVASAQTPAGGEFRVNTYTTGHQAAARLAMEPDGDFVVVWSSYGQDGSDFGVFGQRFAASGAPRGSEFRINTYTTGSQGLPAVAVGSRGDFVVVWESVQDGSGSSIQGRRYDAAGSAIGGEFLVNTFTTGSQFRPRVGRAADGRFVVSWTSQNVDGSVFGIAARRFDASGNPIGSEFVVNTYTTGDQVCGDIAVEANGNFVVVWEDSNGRDGSGSAIFGQRYDASGNRLGSEFQVNTYTTGDQRVPSVSVSPAGGFVVAWTSRSGTGAGMECSPGASMPRGTRWGTTSSSTRTPRAISTASSGRSPTTPAAISSSRGAAPEMAARTAPLPSASALRAPAAAPSSGSTPTPRARRDVPSVASDSVGNFVVAWESGGQDGSDVGVFAQRFGGLGPAALAVDSPGNQVLEPGETVDVRPSWRNFNGAAQTFSGTLTNITGPAGAIYTITDAAGDYGTVADGATAQCTDCYAVSVSNPPTRPVVHWDASAVESIVPDTQGQQKQWLLHVGGSFTDVPTASPFYRFIETLLHHGVTGGCSPTQYCPASSTTREQMAVFVLVAKEGTGYVPPACTTPMFADVPASSPFCRWIEELARRAVVSGCGGGNYCPTNAGHPRADGGLRAAHAGPGAQPAGLHDAHLQRRSRDQRLLPLDRGADPARCGHRLRRRQLLPDRRRDPRADGRLHQRDVRPDAVRAVRVRAGLGLSVPGRITRTPARRG